MSLFSVLKNNSKLALKNNWGKAILVLLITMVASVVMSILQNLALEMFTTPGSVDPTFAMRYGFDEYFFQSTLQTTAPELVILGVFTLLNIFLLSPLSLGIIHWHYQLIHGRDASLNELFRFYESGKAYKRSLWYNINLSVRAFLWALVFYIVPGGIMGGSVAVLYSADRVADRSLVAMATVGVLLASMLFVLATIFYSALINKYALAAYLLCEDDDLSVGEAIKTSIAYTKGYRFSLLWFSFTFFGWILLCTFVVPVLYVGPYMQTSYAMYARYIIEKNRHVPQDQTKEFTVEDASEMQQQQVEQPVLEPELEQPQQPAWPTSSEEMLPSQPDAPTEPPSHLPQDD